MLSHMQRSRRAGLNRRPVGGGAALCAWLGSWILMVLAPMHLSADDRRDHAAVPRSHVFPKLLDSTNTKKEAPWLREHLASSLGKQPSLVQDVHGVERG